jgi:hypothetical protein
MSPPVVNGTMMHLVTWTRNEQEGLLLGRAVAQAVSQSLASHRDGPGSRPDSM